VGVLGVMTGDEFGLAAIGVTPAGTPPYYGSLDPFRVNARPVTGTQKESPAEPGFRCAGLALYPRLIVLIGFENLHVGPPLALHPS